MQVGSNRSFFLSVPMTAVPVAVALAPIASRCPFHGLVAVVVRAPRPHAVNPTPIASAAAAAAATAAERSKIVGNFLTKPGIHDGRYACHRVAANGVISLTRRVTTWLAAPTSGRIRSQNEEASVKRCPTHMLKPCVTCYAPSSGGWVSFGRGEAKTESVTSEGKPTLVTEARPIAVFVLIVPKAIAAVRPQDRQRIPPTFLRRSKRTSSACDDLTIFLSHAAIHGRTRACLGDSR
jgi:hypothetical protein